MKRNSKQNGSGRGLITALDVGSTKIACFIARMAASGEPEIVGIGHQLAAGMRSGNIVDLEAVESSIRTAVEAAEQMAGENVKDVAACISGASPSSKLISFDVSIAGHEIGDADLRPALDPAWLKTRVEEDQQIIHTIPVAFSIDGNRGVRDPRGMFAEKLGVNMVVMSAASGPLRNLETAVSRCHLAVADHVIASYASGLACLVDDETELGATCIDMGGGTTTVSVFFDGEIVHAESIPVGGGHVTNDIARGLSTPVAFAERMKALYGSCVASPSDDTESISVPLVGEDENEAAHVPRSMLVGIIRPRVEEILELVRERLETTGFDKVAGRRVVLTGGASQLTGIRELAAEMLDKNVRIGRPTGFKGLAEATNGPAFSAAAGLIKFIINSQSETAHAALRAMEVPTSRFGRFGMWIRENM